LVEFCVKKKKLKFEVCNKNFWLFVLSVKITLFLNWSRH
jgi:hypothetical protein